MSESGNQMVSIIPLLLAQHLQSFAPHHYEENLVACEAPSWRVGVSPSCSLLTAHQALACSCQDCLLMDSRNSLFVGCTLNIILYIILFI